MCSKSLAIPTGKTSEAGEEVMSSQLLIAKEYARPNMTPLTLAVTDVPAQEVFKVKKP